MEKHPKYGFIDYSLNYGRKLIDSFVAKEINAKIILDLGAGQGDDLLICKKHHPNARLFAMEAYPPYITNLKTKNISVFSCNIENDRLPFEDNTVDIIIVNQIMEHVKEVFWILHEITRILKPNGCLIVGVPNLAGFQNRLLLLAGKQPSTIQNYSAHVRGYTKEDFTKLLNSGFTNGYSLEVFRGSNFYPFPAIFAKPLSKLFPSLSWAIFMKYRKKNTINYSNGFLEYPKVNKLETNFYLGH